MKLPHYRVFWYAAAVLALVGVGLIATSAETPAKLAAKAPEPVRTAVPAPKATAAPSSCGEPPLPPPPPKLLYEFSTKYKAGPKYEGRATNIELLVKKLDRRIIGPGQTWSFNQSAGPRTKEKGFKEAPTYFLGEIRPGIGGGTCQVSSTLYAALLHTNVEFIERRPHSRTSNYIPIGLDATVNFPPECWDKVDNMDPKDHGDPRVCYDLRFKNPYEVDIFLTLETTKELDEDGKKTLKVSVLGYDIPIPKVTTKWAGYNAPPFETRYRKVSWWKDDRKRLKQSGKPGLSGARLVTTTWPDGRTQTKKVYSKYSPTPEVWEVGMEFEKPKDEPEEEVETP